MTVCTRRYLSWPKRSHVRNVCSATWSRIQNIAWSVPLLARPRRAEELVVAWHAVGPSGEIDHAKLGPRLLQDLSCSGERAHVEIVRRPELRFIHVCQDMVGVDHEHLRSRRPDEDTAAGFRRLAPVLFSRKADDDLERMRLLWKARFERCQPVRIG